MRIVECRRARGAIGATLNVMVVVRVLMIVLLAWWCPGCQQIFGLETPVFSVEDAPGIDGTGADVPGPQAPVSLGTAGSYVILAEGGITSVQPSVVTGNLGCSPAAASSITGFTLANDPTNTFSTSMQVSGRIYAADYAAPTPGILMMAILDMERAFNTAAALTPDRTELGGGDIGGMTLVPGVYRWSNGVTIALDVTLAGTATDFWVFQIAGNVDVTANRKVILTGGALAKHVFWQIESSMTVGAEAHLEGVVLIGGSVTLGSGAAVDGILLAQSQVTINLGRITAPL